MNDFDTRFGGIRRLFSVEGLQRLHAAHVCVVGIGGVGSWAVEALARSGVGELTLIDLDEICVSNVNRQLHALDGEFGKAKVEAMAQRVRAIQPTCVVHPVMEFFTESNAERILAAPFDYLLDAMDSISKKALLLALCRQKKLPALTVGAAGGRRQAGAIRVTDLAFASHDRMLQKLRKDLRTQHGFPRDTEKPFGIDCVFSPEPVVYPRKDGSVCVEKESGSKLRLNCDEGYGTASFITGTFGFIAAGEVVARIAKGS